MTFPERFTEIVVDFPRKILLSDANGAYTSEQIFATASAVAAEALGRKSLKGERIALLMPPGLPYVAGMLGGWMSGAMMIPLCTEHPKAELLHVITDAEVKLILCHPSLKALLPETKAPVAIVAPDQPPKEEMPYSWDYPQPADPALMLYTSGTTGKPKGVVHTHASLAAQITCLVEAWEWTENDRILHFLPLHHTHGIINKLLCALWSGARCDMLPKFDPKTVWEKCASESYTLFMAVPTIYSKMIRAWEEETEAARQRFSNACAQFRLMVSGSAALPVSVLEKWKTISSQVLLERYGMTEIGMALSNPLHGERRPGYVGLPLPGMEVRIIAEEDGCPAAEGELQVKGANVFKEYWRKTAETKRSFTPDGWFKTGDMAALENGYYRIVGRLSTDIIKSGGYKISALEIEAALLKLPAVQECAVAGIPDETWGERIAAAVVVNKSETLTLEALCEMLKDELAAYKLPTLLKTVEQLPRNAMGKVVKGEVKKLF